MTEENKALAYQLWLQHWSYADIAAHLEAKQSDVVRAVAAAQRKQDSLCARCSWRKDGLAGREQKGGENCGSKRDFEGSSTPKGGNRQPCMPGMWA